MVPLAFILPGPLFQPEQRASDAGRDTAVDILCAAVAEGRLSLAAASSDPTARYPAVKPDWVLSGTVTGEPGDRLRPQ